MLLAVMKLKALRDRAQTVALISSAACLVSSLWITHLYLNRLSDILFQVSFLIAIVFASLSIPRCRSLLTFAVIAFSLWWSGGRAFASYHSTNFSPDGRYRLVIYSNPSLFVFPGQGSDAAGYVQLQNSDGYVLAEKYIEMVALAQDAKWDAHEVEIGRGDYDYSLNLP